MAGALKPSPLQTVINDNYFDFYILCCISDFGDTHPTPPLLNNKNTLIFLPISSSNVKLCSGI
jgi:hypothetical protein